MSHRILYVIRHHQTGLHKIGITNDWSRRQRELEVGTKTRAVHVVRVNDARQIERFLHRRFKDNRMPQSEWFHLSDEQLEFVRTTVLKSRDDYQQQAARPEPKNNSRPASGSRLNSAAVAAVATRSTPGRPTPAQIANSGPATREATPQRPSQSHVWESFPAVQRSTIRRIDPYRFKDLGYDIRTLILAVFALSITAIAMGVPHQLIRESNLLREKERQKTEMLQRQPSGSQGRPAAQ